MDTSWGVRDKITCDGQDLSQEVLSCKMNTGSYSVGVLHSSKYACQSDLEENPACRTDTSWDALSKHSCDCQGLSLALLLSSVDTS